jgi:hypothetical protein
LGIFNIPQCSLLWRHLAELPSGGVLGYNDYASEKLSRSHDWWYGWRYDTGKSKFDVSQMLNTEEESGVSSTTIIFRSKQ